MLESWIREQYRMNYEMAIDDGHTDEAENIAWAWTEEAMTRQFHKVKGQHEAARQEAINLHLESILG